jgi:hypothetical protein
VGVEHPLRQLEPLPAEHDRSVVQPAAEEVHRRRADELGDEQVRGLVVQELGRPFLLQQPLAHDDDPVAHRHRLDLIVCDEDRRHAELLLEARDLRPHLDA